MRIHRVINSCGSFLKIAFVIVTCLFTSLARAGEIVHEAVLDAPVAEAWKAFTDPAEISTWMVKKCDIDLRIGGLLRTSYNPNADLDGPESIHHEILSFEPERMLSFRTIKSPEGFPYPELIDKTWVVATFESVGTHKTRVRLAMCGYGEGGKWDEMREKFEAGNAWTYEQLQKKFAKKKDGEILTFENEADRVMELLSKLVGGEWLHDGEGPGGSIFRVRNSIRKGPDDKSLVARGWIDNGEKEIEHGSTMVFRDPATKDIRFVNVNEVGDIAEGPITLVNDNTVEWDWRMRGFDTNTYSVLMQFTGDDDYTFILRVRLDDGSLQQLIEADFHRSQRKKD